MSPISIKGRRQMVLIVLLAVLMLYVTSYFILSRRGMRANQALGDIGFGYFSPAVGRLSDEDSERLITYELLLHVVYWPIHTFDVHVLDGPCHSPLHSVM